MVYALFQPADYLRSINQDPNPKYQNKDFIRNVGTGTYFSCSADQKKYCIYLQKSEYGCV